MTVEQIRKLGVRLSIGVLSLAAVTSCFALIYTIIPRDIEQVDINELQQVDNTKILTKITVKSDSFKFEGAPLEHKDVKPSKPVTSTPTLNSHYSVFSQECNKKILDICTQYFTVSNVSPLLIMAICQNETGLRCDNDVTFCALYPSAVVPLTSVEDIEAFGSDDVLQSAEVFSKLASDWWTRDRGPLQMNGSYGVRDDIYNTQLGEDEKSKLRDIQLSSEYTAYTTKEGVITSTRWISEATDKGGDRHNIKDVCLRMSSEFNYASNLIYKNYGDVSERQLACMLSMHHGAGSLWLDSYKDSEIGYWKSGSIACEYARQLSTEETYQQIFNLAQERVKEARAHSYNPSVCLSTADALRLYDNLVAQGLLKDVDEYTVAGTYRDAYITYPLKTLYNMTMLQILYNGG